MEMKDFFSFMSQPASSTVQAHPSDKNIDHLKLIKGNYEGIDFPITFKQEYGNKLYDILDTGFAGFFLISERMRKTLEENTLTGWKVFPIKLYDKKGNEITGYHGFSATGHSGPTSYEKSEIIEKRRVPHGPLCKFYKGVNIDNWDGTDFFTPDGTYQTFITKKAADILKKNKITNVYLENLAEKEMNLDNVLKD
jgi:hypothetical protein